jgi:ATP-dependent RNA helicase DeaD
MTSDLPDFASFAPGILQGLEDLGWSKPMPVQARVIPLMREGRDIIAQAQTGSGKTGAFGLPIVERVDPLLRQVQAMILAPTRELALQIEREMQAMGRHMRVETVPIYGGTAYGPQLQALQGGVHVVAGTPGRILDHLKSRRMKLDHLRVLIFDEADELLSLGFWPDMKEIREFLPRERQTGLFSATIPERVRSLARYFLVDPIFVSLTEGGVRSPEEIEHYQYVVPAQEKEAMLLRILEYEDPDSAIIFCNTRADVRYVTRYLQRHHLDADMIQGEMTQVAREQVMGRIKSAELRFLVATDVAARGIDISDLSHVISYSAPDSPEIYLHRTGRTGRAGKTGTAISLVSGLDVGNFRNVQAVNRMEIPERRLPTAAEAAEHVTRRLVVALEHELRELPEREQRERRERYLPIVEQLASSEAGREVLASALYDVAMQAAHTTPDQAPAPPGRGRAHADETAEPAVDPGASEGGGVADPGEARPRRRRKRRRRGANAGADS